MLTWFLVIPFFLLHAKWKATEFQKRGSSATSLSFLVAARWRASPTRQRRVCIVIHPHENLFTDRPPVEMHKRIP